jgi:hypothetical protein
VAVPEVLKPPEMDAVASVTDVTATDCVTVKTRACARSSEAVTFTVDVAAGAVVETEKVPVCDPSGIVRVAGT